jgi:hypothetical protein
MPVRYDRRQAVPVLNDPGTSRMVGPVRFRRSQSRRVRSRSWSFSLRAIGRVRGPDLHDLRHRAGKQEILDFIRITTDTAGPKFVPLEDRIATFDQDGTLWV